MVGLSLDEKTYKAPKNFKPILKFFIWIDFIGCLFGDNIQIILLQESKVLSSFGKLSLLHTFPNIPMNESSLGIHQVVLRIDALSKDTTNSNIVTDHCDIFCSFCSNIIFD